MANSVERIKANIAKNIREIVSFELNIEKLDFMTITNIDVSSDHSYAKIYVSFFQNPQKNIEKLNKVKGFVRTSLAKRLKLRRVPQVVFVLDDSYIKDQRMNEILKKEETIINNFNKNEEN